MIGRIIRHRKWSKELNAYLRRSEVFDSLPVELRRLGITHIYIMWDAKNYATYVNLKKAFERHTDFNITFIKAQSKDVFTGVGADCLLVSDNKWKEYVFEQVVSFLSLFDIYNFLENRQYFTPELPRVFNSIENGYRQIGVVGSGKYADEIKQHLQGNSEINIVEIVDNQNLKTVKGKYCYCGNENVEIVVFADFRIVAKVTDEKGDCIPAFFLVTLTNVNNGFINDSAFDLEKNIVPCLVEQGIKVIWCQKPELQCFSDKVSKKIRRDSFVRNISPALYSKIRKRELENEQLGFMYGLGNNTKADCSKGWREVFGNMANLNYDNGFRRTIGNDHESKGSVWIFGPCLVDPNARVDDSRTVASVLKRQIGKGYNVYNRGGSFGGMALLLRNTSYNKGDIAIIISNSRNRNEEATVNYDLTESYQKIDSLEKHINDNLLHCDSSVIAQIANDLFDIIMEEKLMCDADVSGQQKVCVGNKVKRVPDLTMLEEGEFKEYLYDLRNHRRDVDGGSVGAIVMNCNPFTLGHRYLIETAAKSVDYLYIFVVEEDKSFFTFQDRYELVLQGTKDIENVCVLPSGKHIISSQTLAGYFEKDTVGRVYLDATTDLELFAQIAKVLNITVRFAGEEPIDLFTNQYNDNMARILPQYGIEFRTIPRKETGGKIISASLVRKYLEEGNFEAIKELVPETTYKFLERTSYISSMETE